MGDSPWQAVKLPEDTSCQLVQLNPGLKPVSPIRIAAEMNTLNLNWPTSTQCNYIYMYNFICVWIYWVPKNIHHDQLVQLLRFILTHVLANESVLLMNIYLHIYPNDIRNINNNIRWPLMEYHKNLISDSLLYKYHCQLNSPWLSNNSKGNVINGSYQHSWARMT